MYRLLPVVALVLCAGCGESSTNDEVVQLQEVQQTSQQRQASGQASGQASRQAPAPPPAPPGSAAPVPPPDSVGLKIIRTATLRLRVDDYARSRAAVDTLLRGFDAYLASEHEARGYGGLEGQLTLRVAAGQFPALLDALLGLAEEVAYKEITAEDVTEQYVDVQAQLRARRAVEERYLEILAQARTVEDILAVETNLRVIREEIERAEGRLRYLQNRVGYSTIHLTLYEGSRSAGTARPFWPRLRDALGDGWAGLLDLLVGVIRAWPFWLFLFAVLVPLRRWWRTRRRSKGEVRSSK